MSNRKPLIFLWLFFHIFAVVVFVIRHENIAKIDTNFLSITPKFLEDKDFQKPLEDFFLKNSSTVKIFVESEDFDIAKDNALKLEEYINELDTNVQVNLYSKNYDDVLNMIVKYKYQLLPNEIRNYLLNDEAYIVSENSLANFYSPFFIPIVDNVEDDPFFVVNSKINEILVSENNMESRDGIQFINYDNKYNVLLNIDMPKKIDSDNFFNNLTSFLSTLETNENIKTYISGVPIHTYYSQKSAQREITIISIVSLIVICLMFIFVFKSVKPYIISMCTIFLAGASAFLLSSVFFSSIHIFTFVFGTSLIGISIDHSIHFITEWYNEKDKKEVLKKIFPSMLLGFITTIISYLSLSLTSLTLLKQIALFSIFGLVSSFLTVNIMYPIIFKNDKRVIKDSVINLSKNILVRYVKLINTKIIAVFFIIVILVSILTIPRIKVNFSANQLYSTPDFLLESETEVYKRLNTSLAKNIIISRGDTLSKALQAEESIGNSFTNNYMAISRVLYSEEMQRDNMKLVEKKLMPLLRTQINSLDLNESSYNKIMTEFSNVKNEILDINAIIDEPSFSDLKKIIVTNNNKYFLIATSDYNTNNIVKSANKDVKIFNINEEINDALDSTAKTALKMAIIAYILIFIAIMIYFNKKQALAIILVQMMSILINLSLHSIFSININIFSIFALILSIGISIDYAIFFSNSAADKEITFLAVFLSMMTTVLSFGTLAFSGFIPVKSFGLFLFIGVLSSFIISPILFKFNKLIKNV
ncbi:MMPL family transporter [uncultured Brachyspira sp.]|uniref:MMPL family transporter n=1 Tax=uncultured Brachyspira sp. TaxID=221953 RepID=UPI00261AE703|nr:MMPL family transporter [uncultured Brachyspira sp.]